MVETLKRLHNIFYDQMIICMISHLLISKDNLKREAWNLSKFDVTLLTLNQVVIILDWLCLIFTWLNIIFINSEVLSRAYSSDEAK